MADRIMTSLDGIEVFDGLTVPELEKANALVHWTQIGKGAEVISNSDESGDICLLQEGTVKAITYSFSGKEVAYQNLYAGEIFGELSAIDGGARTTSVVAVTDCVVGRLSSQNFWVLMEAHPAFMHKIVTRLASLSRVLIGRVYQYSAMNVKDRIRSEIIRLAKESEGEDNTAFIEKMPTHENLANKLATHREAVTKEISFLVKNNYLEKKGKSLVIPDMLRFRSLVEEDA